ncbi:MAG: sigma-70 family RNA polymerase sigma factor [Gammaproteobacteria bacterium]|nr:sigma-70 family RNA polymerase sigma factor [Gammaproteobacteria bacterium]
MKVVHTDKRLANRMRRGEQAAFDEFFADYFPRVYRFAIRRVGNDEQVVRDVVQATLSRAVEKIGSYRGEAALFTWICRLCRNEIADHYRHTQRRIDHEVLLDDERLQAVLESLDSNYRHDPAIAAERQQLGETIQLILDYLPSRQGNALEWKYIQGLTVREIAQRLEVTETAAQSLLARARQAFREGFDAVAQRQPDGLLP